MFVYILMNKSNSVNYTGVTNDLNRRIYEHKTDYNEKSFTSQYNVKKLVYFEEFEDPASAIAREKQIKGLSKEKKFNLIRQMNPNFEDLAKDWFTNTKDDAER